MRALAVLAVCFVTLALVWLSTRRERALPPEIAEIRGVSSPITEPLALVEHDKPADVRVEVAPDSAPITAVEPSAAQPAAPAPSVHCALVGRAVDDEGVPVEDALVTLSVFGGGTQDAPHATAHTDGSGHFVFELPSVIPAEARVKFSVSGTKFHAPASRSEPRVWTEGENDVGDFVLVRSGVLTGRVQDSMGAPVEAFIELSPVPKGRRTALTTPKGVYRLRDLPEGTYAIEARADGYTARTLSELDVYVGEETVVPDIVLASAPSIRGIVFDDEDSPVSGVRVEGRSVRSGEKATTKSNAYGSFVLYLPSDGLTVLSVSGDERGFQDWGGTDGPGVTFSTGASDVRIFLKHLPRMRFVVVDGARAPIERFELTLSETRPGGWRNRLETVMLGNHPRGEVRLPVRNANRVTVGAPKFVPVELPIAANHSGTDVQTIQLAPASMLSGRVRVSGAAITDGSVSIEPEGVREEAGEDQPERRTQLTKEDGAFAFDELGPGTYTLRAKGAGASPETMTGIVVTSEQHLELGDIDLDPAAIVRGVILTDARESATHFSVKVDERSERVVPTKDARFEFKSVTAGAHTLVWSRQQSSGHVAPDPHTLDFVVGSGETRDIVIDARDSTPCTLTFRVLRSGVPVVHVDLYGSSEERRSRSKSTLLATTDANGNATVHLEANRSLRIDILNDAEHYLGGVGRMLELVPGGSVSELIQIETGRLVVELPESLTPPKEGRVKLWFKDNTQPFSYALAPQAEARDVARPVAWTSRTIDFGEYAAGSYDVGLSFWQFRRDGRSSHAEGEEMHPGHEERIEIRNGAVTRIVVP